MTKTKMTLKVNYTKFTQKLKLTLVQRMNKVMVNIVAYIKTSFGPSNEKGKNPSEEGDTPNIGLSTLRDNITFKVTTEDKDVIGTYGVQIGPAGGYARRLELGFYGIVHVAAHARGDKQIGAFSYNVAQGARPFLVPAYQNNKNIIKNILRGK
jgi:hypothetical protein